MVILRESHIWRLRAMSDANKKELSGPISALCEQVNKLTWVLEELTKTLIKILEELKERHI